MATSTISPASVSTTDVRAEASAGDAGAPNLANYLIWSVAITTVLFIVGVGGGLYLYSREVPLSFGVGLFTAFWGGPGFGLMAGFALHALRSESRAGH